jgi:hypothetical protein
MKDRDLEETYARLLERDAPRDRDACPTPEEMRDLVERSGPEAERLRVLDHVMACAHCRREFDLLRTVASARSRIRPPRRPRMALAAAAVLVLAAGGIFTWQMTGPPGGEEDALRTGAAGVAIVAPEGAVAPDAASVLIWRAVEGAVRYEIEVTDSEGRPVFAATTSDTTVLLPAENLPSAGEDRIWWVEAVLMTGGRLRSPATRFTLGR